MFFRSRVMADQPASARDGAGSQARPRGRGLYFWMMKCVMHQRDKERSFRRDTETSTPGSVRYLNVQSCISCHSELLARRSTKSTLRQGHIEFHERIRARGSARPAKLSRRATHRLVGLFRIHPLADSARAATCNPAVGAGLSSRDGSEPDRCLVTETPRTALLWCHPGDAGADCCHHDHHPVCHSAPEPTTAGAHAQHAKHVARHSHPDRVVDEKLSGSSRGTTKDG